MTSNAKKSYLFISNQNIFLHLTSMSKYINNNNITSKSYRNFGTNANVNLSNSAGILPVKNFTGGMHPDAYLISGEQSYKLLNKNPEPYKGYLASRFQVSTIHSVN